MAYHFDKNTGDLVVDGFEQGIASSPHKGIANMQAANISTETGEVMCSYSRTKQTQTIVGNGNGTLTASGGSGAFYLVTSPALQVGTWISVSASTITSITATNYYVVLVNNGQVQLSLTYNGSPVSHGTSGTATFATMANMGRPIAKATEPYNDSAGAQQYRYYVLDALGYVWVYDTAVYASSLFVTGTGTTWFLPDTSLSYLSGLAAPSGMAVLNGWLHVFAGNNIWCKPTVNLGDTTTTNTTWLIFASGVLCNLPSSTVPHYAFSGHQGKLYYTDGNLLGSIFPNTSLLTTLANIQSYASYTTVTTTGTISALIGGSVPSLQNAAVTRVPAVFFPSSGGANPTALTAGTIYYIKYLLGTSTFEVYAAATGGAALDIATGKSGTLYFNTYYPTSAGGVATITWTPERLNLPFFEVAQCIAELGSIIIIGCRGNTMYPWNQIDAIPGDLISLPEANVSSLLTVNNMVYAFAGFKGNIYITSGSSAAMALTVPDYTSGLIEPYFTWGDSMYLRGRVYFSILDQTSTHTGQCGGVWSFIPTQNFYIGQDVGTALRLENQNSYATYNGYATVLLPAQDQSARGPQYWAGWQSSTSSPTYGIDASSATPGTSAVVQTDIIPTGTAIQKKTFSQLEYKLAAPLDSGESVAFAYRLNLTDAFQTCGTVKADSSTALSGYFSINFQKTQWLQLQATLNPSNASSSSFVRLSQILIR